MALIVSGCGATSEAWIADDPFLDPAVWQADAPPAVHSEPIPVEQDALARFVVRSDTEDPCRADLRIRPGEGDEVVWAMEAIGLPTEPLRLEHLVAGPVRITVDGDCHVLADIRPVQEPGRLVSDHAYTPDELRDALRAYADLVVARTRYCVALADASAGPNPGNICWGLGAVGGDLAATELMAVASLRLKETPPGFEAATRAAGELTRAAVDTEAAVTYYLGQEQPAAEDLELVRQRLAATEQFAADLLEAIR